ncbi:MAG: TlpA family protein disulfide reductase [Deltaproteobacteria bacterium]|nr:TlpA family protein disulfide reductase [Deltaproteobacteria bacterium]
MKFYLYTRLFKILTILLLIAFSGCSSENDTKNSNPIEAPDFTLGSIAGENITLSNLRGKVVLLDFWATYCAPCVQTIPELLRINERYGDRDLVVLGISLDTKAQASDEQLKKFMATFNIKYPVMRDDGVVSKAYYGDSLIAIPTLHIINKQGKIVRTIMGFKPGEAEKTVKTLL